MDDKMVELNVKIKLTEMEAIELREYLLKVWKPKSKKNRPGRPRKAKS